VWGIFVFGELHDAPRAVLAQVVGGSLVMAIGAGLIALSSVSRSEHLRWEDAAAREGGRYAVDPEYTRLRIAGESAGAVRRRTWVDWLVVGFASAIIIAFAVAARPPQIQLHIGWTAALVVATVAMLGGAGGALWRATRFN
jgi:hypothetical protein